MERTSHLLTPASLKALAHPVRVQVLGLLRVDGPATATGLAARIGESSGTTSYHLRQLASADFVVEDTTRGNGRERWWRAAQDSTEMRSSELDDDPATLAAADAYLDVITKHRSARVVEWVRGARTWPKRWREAATLDDYLLHLSAAEVARLSAEVDALVESYRREPRKGDERVVVHWAAFPMRTDA